MPTRPNIRVGTLTLEEGQRLAAGRRESLPQGGGAKRRHPSGATLEKHQCNPDKMARATSNQRLVHVFVSRIAGDSAFKGGAR
jgi:hypothetical protein